MSALLRRVIEFARSDDDVTAGELREAASAHGCEPISPDTDREVVTVAGTISAVTLRPRATVPALVATLYDGSMSIQLVWLGRRRINGIEPGTYVKVTGLLCRPDGVASMYNPSYELVAP